MKKLSAIILTAIIAVSALSLAASAYAMPFMNWKNFQNMPGNSHRTATQQSSARIGGFVTGWGDTNVTGTISAFSQTVVLNNTDVRQGSSATAIWTTNQSRPINTIQSRENFTYTFYTARLVNANVSSLNTNGYSLFLNGTWNVYEVTSSFNMTTDSSGEITSFNRSQNAVAVVTNAYGELAVSSTESNFTLSITGVDSLTGSVHVSRIMTKLCNPFKILNDDSSTTVTKADVATIVSSYGACPGWGQYDQNMDYNFNYKIDITDLATAAANINS
jgi:hypothetical protein